MKKLSIVTLLATFVIFASSGCQVIGGIFKAGVWVGILVVVFIVALVLWLINKVKS